MYCPKCGQHISDNMRFCSRCGLSLSAVSEWLEGGGGGLAVREEAERDVLSPRRKGMRRGGKTMFWGGVLLPIFFGLSIVVDSPVPLLVPFIIVLAGLSVLLYSRLFGEEILSNRSKQAQDMRFGTRPDNSALPPAFDAGMINGGRRQARTAEMTQPPSVTEQTTKLLASE
jgi:hypothetical protein